MSEKPSKEELVRLVERIQNAEGTEEEIDAMIERFQASVPGRCPSILFAIRKLARNRCCFERQPVRTMYSHDQRACPLFKGLDCGQTLT